MKNFLQSLSPFTKILSSAGLALILYSILARNIPINFFWEATYFGAILILISVLGFFITLIKKRKQEKKNSIGLKIGIGFICFALAVQALMAFIIPNSEAYSAAKTELLKNENIKAEVGKIQGFSFIPIGQISIQETPVDYSGEAQFYIIVKGEKKYLFLTVSMHKYYEEKWEIRAIY